MSQQEIRFNTQTCRRCGGTGHYSFNVVDGTRCFGCRGAGKVRTAAAKRSALALTEWANSVASVPVTEVKVGDVVRLAKAFGRDKYVEVEEVEHRDDLFSAESNGDNRVETNVRVILRGNGHGQQWAIYAERPVPTVRRRLTVEEYGEYLKYAETLSGVSVVTKEEVAA